MSRSNNQLNLPPQEVEPLNRKRLSTQPAQLLSVKAPNLLSVTRRALANASLSNRWLAHIFGCSEQLVSAQLSDHSDKHLSMRKLSRIDDAGFWREFLMLLAEDLGLEVIVVTPEQRAAIREVVAASANLQRVNPL